MRSRWIIPERVNERIEEAVEKAMKSQMESIGDIPREGDEKRSMDDLTALAKAMIDTREYGISVDGKNDVAGEANKVVKEPFESTTLSYIPEEIKEYISKEIQKMMDEKKESVREMLQAGGSMNNPVLMRGDTHISFPIIDALPNDLRERVESISLDPDGKIFILFREVNHGTDE